MSSQAQNTAGDFTVVSARILREEHVALRRLADADERTVSWLLRRLIQQTIADAAVEDIAA